MKYISNISSRKESDKRMGASSTLLISTLLLVALIGLTGCPDDGGNGNGGNGNPPPPFSFVASFGSTGTADGEFQAPVGIAVDDTRVYVLDDERHDVQIFSKTNALDEDATTNPFMVQFGEEGTTMDGQFSAPVSIAVDNTDIYVLDTFRTNLQIFSKSNPSTNIIVFIGSSGSTVGTSGNQFLVPIAVAVDETAIYVADTNSNNIQGYRKSRAFIGRFGGVGDGDGQFQNSTGIASDGTHIYVLDNMRKDVQIFNKTNALDEDAATNPFVAKFGGSGTADGQFDTPSGIAVDNTRIYVVDSGRDDVQVFLKSDRSFVAKFGGSGTADGQFDTPSGIAVDNTHIYVLDSGRDDVQVFTK